MDTVPVAEPAVGSEDESPSDHHRSKRTYLFTKDLGPKISLLRQAGIKTPAIDDPIITGIQAQMEKMLVGYFPNNAVLPISMADLAQDVLTQASKQVDNWDKSLIISTCSDIADQSHGVEIQINRIIDSQGNIIGLGPRPGYPDLYEQVRQLQSLHYNKEIILVEDGTFTGSTLKKIICLLGGSIKKIVVGIAFPKAIDELRQNFMGDIVVIEKVNNPIDWMPDHDFFPFIPNCGRVIGRPKFENEGDPFTVDNGGILDGASVCMPYLLPYCSRMKQWTSIPQKHLLPMSRFCLKAMIDLYDALEQLNGSAIWMSDLKAVSPRISIPIMSGSNIFAHEYSDFRIINALRGALLRLNK